jgi:hypothetical protein
MRLSDREIYLIRALTQGSTLKAHRDLDGSKICRLHSLAGVVEELNRSLVDGLQKRGLIDSNKKFPAATFLLTEQGRQIAEELGGQMINPLTAKNY